MNLFVCKYSHGDTRGASPRSVEELPPTVGLQLWVRLSLPGALHSVDGLNEVQVMFIWHLQQPVGGILVIYSFSLKDQLTPKDHGEAVR